MQLLDRDHLNHYGLNWILPGPVMGYDISKQGHNFNKHDWVGGFLYHYRSPHAPTRRCQRLLSPFEAFAPGLTMNYGILA